MQHARRYLEAVLPATGLRIVASKPPSWTKGFKHTFLATNDEVLDVAARLDAAGVTNYIALATYASPDAGRTATNTVELQCLWLDVDYKHYPSPEDAQAAVAKFYEIVGAPTIRVQSGGGLHAYWCLRAPMPTAEWKPLADAFQATWQNLGIKADPISADAARVLRIPGTHNFKPEYGEPREVVLESFDDVTYDAAALAKKLKARAPEPRMEVINIPAGFTLNDDLGAGLGHRPSHIGPIVRQCVQMQTIYKNQATIPEPLWYAGVQLAYHLENGRNVAHLLSNKHPKYDPAETDAKLAQVEVKGVGPTTCERFRSLNPSGCEGCQFKITSPIQLGYKEPEAQQPTIVVTETVVTESGEVTVVEHVKPAEYPVPEGFKYNNGVVLRRHYDAESQITSWEPIFNGFLTPQRVIVNERNNHATDIQLYVATIGQSVKNVTVPGKTLADKRDMVRELSSRGIFSMSKDASYLLEYLQRMVQDVQSKKRDAATAEQMGWQPDGMFVVGATGYREDADPLYDLPVPASTRSVVQNYAPAGSLDEWKRTAAVYNHPGAEPYQFALCYGAAGVFLPIAKLSGVVLSLYSQAAGRGKSTAGYGALSWWGNPGGLKSQSKDTNNALFHKASRHKNLPILMDEVTDKPNWELGDLVYYMSQGREKERLTADSAARPVLPEWALPVISTSNNSIRSKLQIHRGDVQGLFARIIELQMDLPFAERMGFADRMTLRSGFLENYGHAGPILVKAHMANPSLAKRAMDGLVGKLDAAVDGDSAYRFWIASAAAALTVCVVAHQKGLLPYDPAALLEWTTGMLKTQRREATAQIATSADVLAQFLEQNANRIIVSYMRSQGGVQMAAVYPQDGVHGSQLVGRVEMPKVSLYISASAFMRFCNEAGFDMGSFVKNATRPDPVSGVALLKQSAMPSVNLGRGTKTASANTKSLEFNLMHPSLRDFAVGIDSRIEESTNIRSVK